MIRQMRYFAAVVRCKNFSEAADACYISQSAMSQQIQALERELGVTLLIRERRRFELTPAGEYFYKKSRTLLRSFDRMVEETRRLGSGAEKALAIGYPRQYRGAEVRAIIPDFQKKHPGIPLRLTSGVHDDLYEDLRDDKVDLVINDMRRQPSAQYVNHLLSVGKVFVELPKDSPLAARPALTASDLGDTPCILLSSPQRQEVEEAYFREYFDLSSDFIHTETLEDVRLFLLSYRGFYLAEYEDAPPEDDESFVFRPLEKDGAQITRSYYAFWKKNRSETFLTDFVRMLDAKMKK